MFTYRVGLNSHKQMSDGINKEFSWLKIDHFDYLFVFNSSTAFYHCTRGPSSYIQQKLTCFIIANITHYCWLHFEAFTHMSFSGHWNSSSAPWCMKTSSVTVNFAECLALELSVRSDIVLYAVLMQQRKWVFWCDVGLCSFTSASAVQWCFIPSVCCMCHLLNSVIILADLDYY